MNFSPLRTLFRKSPKRTTVKKQQRHLDKWYEYSSMNDIYNPTLTRMSKLRDERLLSQKKKKDIGSA